MREQELRKIVEEIVSVLAQKGYLKTGSCGCDGPSGTSKGMLSEGGRTTIGTSGKVFSDEWTYKGKSDPRAQSKLKGPASGDEHDHTGTANCPRCAVSEH